MVAAALAAALLLAAPAPDLHAVPPADLAPRPLGGGARVLDPGPFQPGELAGAGLGLLAGDAAVLGLTYGTYQLFVSGALSPSVGNYRRAAYGLVAAALILPPLGAVLGGHLWHAGPASGDGWKAFLLSLVGHAASLVVAYLAAPAYWVVLPAQLATMTAGASVGLHWGPRPRLEREVRGPRPPAEPAAAAPVAFRGPPICPDDGA